MKKKIKKDLSFCTPDSFLNSLKEMITEQQEKNFKEDRIDENRRDVCRLLGNLYNFSLEKDRPDW